MQQGDLRSKYVSATGAVGVGRTRIKCMYLVPGATAGSAIFTDGSSTGPTLIRLDTIANGQATLVELPADGVLSQNDPFLTLTNVTSVTVFYG
jgi:hypothetical protein